MYEIGRIFLSLVLGYADKRDVVELLVQSLGFGKGALARLAVLREDCLLYTSPSPRDS